MITKSEAQQKGYTIRWRKSSATFVIYRGRVVFESGFATEDAALNFLERWLWRQSTKSAARPGCLVATEWIEVSTKKPELNTSSHVGWMGYTIKRKLDFPPKGDEIGYVVTKGGCNIMPGATWFGSVADAQKGIAAYVLACRIAPVTHDGGIKTCEGDIFWSLMELTK